MTKTKPTTEAQPAIEVKNISKTFRIPLDGSTNLKQKIVNIFKKKKGYRDFTPLNNITFTVNKGDFFGIVGRNGSGKSTLLKSIAGIYTPEKGHVKVHGLLVPFIELGVGFNPELTGRENIFLNGALLGFSRKEMQAMYDEIVDFAELHDFMEERLKNYSSGMQVRLAFSIAIRAQGDILLLDEVLAVGDEAFQRKCFSYFRQLKDDKKTVVLVTHSMDAVERFCNKAMLIESGKITKIGDPTEVAQLYTDINVTHKPKKKKPTAAAVHNTALLDKGLEVFISLENQNHEPLEVLRPENKLVIVIEIKSKIDANDLAYGTIIYNSQNIAVFASNTLNEKKEINLKKNKSIKLIYEIDNIFSNDNYRITASLKNRSKSEEYFTNKKAAEFPSTGRNHSFAVASPYFISKVIDVTADNE